MVLKFFFNPFIHRVKMYPLGPDHSNFNKKSFKYKSVFHDFLLVNFPLDSEFTTILYSVKLLD
jgi:hypothetical protein